MNSIIKVLFIGGVFDEKSELEVLENTKGYAELSANIFQKKLLKGFEGKADVKVLSAPLTGAFPMGYKKMRFKGFKASQSEYTYVKFNNIWGIRNFSRAKSLKNKIKSYKKLGKSFDLIIIYSAHTPFLQAGAYAKKLFSKAKICYVVPDLPQYMNLNEHRSKLYDLFKKYDIKKMDKLSTVVDSFVVLTEPMKSVLKVGERPCAVIEGIVESVENNDFPSKKEQSIKNIVYTGKMNFKFGIKELVDAFMQIENDDYRLVLCGDGDAREYVLEKSMIDKRIEYKGQVSHAKAKEWISRADVLVNPRPNNEEYTKYSFPSKNIEYLSSGNPVVAYLLDGMLREYGEFIFTIENGDFSSAIKSALDCEDYAQRYERFVNYASQKLTSDKVADAILKMNFSKVESRHEIGI